MNDDRDLLLEIAADVADGQLVDEASRENNPCARRQKK